MPLTPFHASVPWLAYVRRPAAFSFWALTLGAMMPDLEVLPLFALSPDIYAARGPMHSLVGALTFDAALTVLAVIVLFPPAIRWFERRWPGSDVFRFAGQDLRSDPRGLLTLYGSAVLGGLTHVLVDLPTHRYNPLLWPWQAGPLTLVPFADELWWDLVTGALWLAFFVLMMRAHWRR